jgi:toxin ParE1/3/4
VRIRWLASGLRSLASAYEYVKRENPAAAKAVADRIERATDRLGQHPQSGRPGTVAGTREVVIPGIPYIVVYRGTDTEVQILRVFHASRGR